MQNTIKTFGLIVLAAVIGFSFFACGDGDDDGGGDPGKLTITSLGDFNGKYVYAMGYDATETVMLVATKSINFSRQEIVCEKITSGSVTLNVWKMNSSGTNGTRYNGSDNIIFEVYILNKEKPDFDEDEEIAVGMVTVAFTNGTASGAFFDISSW